MVKEKYKIGADLGGTKIETVILNDKDEEIHRKRIITPRETGSNEYHLILEALCDFIIETINQLPKNSEFTIGIGMPGRIESKTNLAYNCNTTCLNDKPLKKDIEDRIKQRVRMENDANCFTLAESVKGAAKEYEVVFGIIMGTGCGGGISFNGKLLKGQHGITGEWGHVSIDHQGELCYCGNLGCIESKISGKGVENNFYSQFKYHLKMEDIVKGFRKKDPDCTKVFLQFIDSFGRAVGGLISILDPDAIVIGGGLSNIDELYDLGVDKVREYAFHPRITTPIIKNELGDSAGVFGAAWIGQQG